MVNWHSLIEYLLVLRQKILLRLIFLSHRIQKSKLGQQLYREYWPVVQRYVLVVARPVVRFVQSSPWKLTLIASGLLIGIIVINFSQNKEFRYFQYDSIDPLLKNPDVHLRPNFNDINRISLLATDEEKWLQLVSVARRQKRLAETRQFLQQDGMPYTPQIILTERFYLDDGRIARVQKYDGHRNVESVSTYIYGDDPSSYEVLVYPHGSTEATEIITYYLRPKDGSLRALLREPYVAKNVDDDAAKAADEATDVVLVDGIPQEDQGENSLALNDENSVGNEDVALPPSDIANDIGLEEESVKAVEVATKEESDFMKNLPSSAVRDEDFERQKSNSVDLGIYWAKNQDTNLYTVLIDERNLFYKEYNNQSLEVVNSWYQNSKQKKRSARVYDDNAQLIQEITYLDDGLTQTSYYADNLIRTLEFAEQDFVYETKSFTYDDNNLLVSAENYDVFSGDSEQWSYSYRDNELSQESYSVNNIKQMEIFYNDRGYKEKEIVWEQGEAVFNIFYNDFGIETDVVFLETDSKIDYKGLLEQL